jgi:hypothetical protein
MMFDLELAHLVKLVLAGLLAAYILGQVLMLYSLAHNRHR